MTAPTFDSAWRALQGHGHIPQVTSASRYAAAAGDVFRRSFDQVEPEREKVLRTTAQLMTAAYVRECLRAQAAADALPADVLQAVAHRGIETADSEAARSRAAIRGRPIRCSMTARRAALVGCAASGAPPIHARNNSQSQEVSHD